MSVTPLPVGILIPMLSTGSITIRRRGQPTINAYGEREPATPVLVEVDEAVIHPASEATLEQYPVADRAKDHLEIYTETVPLRTAGDNGIADEVYAAGAWYKVIGASDYQAQGGVYFALAERLGPQ